MTIKYIHLLAINLWLGGMIFFSFIGAPAVFKNLSRHDAGTVVGDIFPKYWILGYICSGVLLITLYLLSKDNFALIKTPFIILAVTASLALISGLVVGSKARAVKTEMRAESVAEAKVSELRKQFGKLHGVSSVLNLIIIILNLVYLAYVPGIMKL